MSIPVLGPERGIPGPSGLLSALAALSQAVPGYFQGRQLAEGEQDRQRTQALSTLPYLINAARMGAPGADAGLSRVWAQLGLPPLGGGSTPGGPQQPSGPAQPISELAGRAAAPQGAPAPATGPSRLAVPTTPGIGRTPQPSPSTGPASTPGANRSATPPSILSPQDQSYAQSQQAPPPDSTQADALIRRYSQQYGVPYQIARGVFMTESGQQLSGPDSNEGAEGPMQLMPGTARDLGVNPRNPQQNIEGGVRKLAMLYQQYGSWARALAAYNAGGGTLGRTGIPGSTSPYVGKVLGYAQALDQAQQTGKPAASAPGGKPTIPGRAIAQQPGALPTADPMGAPQTGQAPVAQPGALPEQGQVAPTNPYLAAFGGAPLTDAQVTAFEALPPQQRMADAAARMGYTPDPQTAQMILSLPFRPNETAMTGFLNGFNTAITDASRQGPGAVIGAIQRYAPIAQQYYGIDNLGSFVTPEVLSEMTQQAQLTAAHLGSQIGLNDTNIARIRAETGAHVQQMMASSQEAMARTQAIPIQLGQAAQRLNLESQNLQMRQQEFSLRLESATTPGSYANILGGMRQEANRVNSQLTRWQNLLKSPSGAGKPSYLALISSSGLQGQPADIQQAFQSYQQLRSHLDDVNATIEYYQGHQSQIQNSLLHSQGAPPYVRVVGGRDITTDMSHMEGTMPSSGFSGASSGGATPGGGGRTITVGGKTYTIGQTIRYGNGRARVTPQGLVPVP